MPKKQLPKQLKAEAAEYLKLDAASKEASNATNRQKTALRNAVKGFWATEGLPHGSYIVTNGLQIKYEAAESSKLSTEKVLELYEDGEITREQLIQLLNVDRTQANTILGGDIVASISYTEVGKKADIRIEKLPIERLKEEHIEIAHKKTRARRRVKIGRKGQSHKTQGRVKRRLRVRNND
jgi:hypothetical protein